MKKQTEHTPATPEQKRHGAFPASETAMWVPQTLHKVVTTFTETSPILRTHGQRFLAAVTYVHSDTGEHQTLPVQHNEP
jgi:hypothetical protein